MDKTIEDYQKENENLKRQLHETTRILKIIHYAWQRSRWHFPKVTGPQMSNLIHDNEVMLGED